MAKVDKKLLSRVAENARLNLTEEETQKFLPQFKEILEAFAKLDKIETEKEKPSFQPIRLENVMRQDIKEKSLTQEEALSNAKNRKNGYFLGPKVA